jgi:hypothetical protein
VPSLNGKPPLIDSLIPIYQLTFEMSKQVNRRFFHPRDIKYSDTDCRWSVESDVIGKKRFNNNDRK